MSTPLLMLVGPKVYGTLEIVQGLEAADKNAKELKDLHTCQAQFS